MDILILVIAILISIGGIIGSILPGLPGHPLNYLALWMVQWAIEPFSMTFLIVLGLITALVMVLDMMIPIWTGKKFGATRQGIAGSIIGMIVGMFLTPVGMILGMIAGAILGDLMAGRNSDQAFKSGLATFAGTLISIGLKLMLAGFMTFMIILNILQYYYT